MERAVRTVLAGFRLQEQVGKRIPQEQVPVLISLQNIAQAPNFNYANQFFCN